MATLAELKNEIVLLMKYAVPENRLREAIELVETCATDVVGLNLLRAFYSYLPEGQDDLVRELRLVARKQGAFLVCLKSNIDDYLYLATREGADLLGRLADGLWDQEMLDFFGITDQQALLDRVVATAGRYQPAHQDEDVCPACFAAIGEYHTLGCPVEVCPWCKGQLTYCHCRFTKLEAERLETAADLERLLEALSGIGRIAFASEQRPAYPSFGDEDEEDNRNM